VASRVFRTVSPPHSLNCEAFTFLDLASPSEFSGDRRHPLSRLPPLSRFVQGAPPPFHLRVSTPRSKPPSAWRLPSARHVPTSWFLTTLTAYSTRWPAGLLHPTTGLGVRCVLTRSAFHTLQSLSLASSRTASPRPLPSCCYHRLPVRRPLDEATELRLVKLRSASRPPRHQARCRPAAEATKRQCATTPTNRAEARLTTVAPNLPVDWLSQLGS
jgi:hypothetical protein